MSKLRRTGVAALVLVAVLAGCPGGPPAERSQRGELTVTVQNADEVSHGVNVTLVDNDTEIGGMGAGPVRPGESVRFSATETEGPVTVRIRTATVSRSVEWSPSDCADLRVEATVGPGGAVDATSRCASG